MKLKNFIYEKANGEVSERTGVVVKEPHKNYLMIDLSDLHEEDQQDVFEVMEAIDTYKEEMLSGISDLIKWRTFKPEGITWR
jgi:hypothetical protein